MKTKKEQVKPPFEAIVKKFNNGFVIEFKYYNVNPNLDDGRYRYESYVAANDEALQVILLNGFRGVYDER